jgi:hypothetical protein
MSSHTPMLSVSFGTSAKYPAMTPCALSAIGDIQSRNSALPFHLPGPPYAFYPDTVGRLLPARSKHIPVY